MAFLPPSVAPNSPVRDRTTGSVNGFAKLDANLGSQSFAHRPGSPLFCNCCCALALTLDVPIFVVLLAASSCCRRATRF